jgi:hypothetical protein
VHHKPVPFIPLIPKASTASLNWHVEIAIIASYGSSFRKSPVRYSYPKEPDPYPTGGSGSISY